MRKLLIISLIFFVCVSTFSCSDAPSDSGKEVKSTNPIVKGGRYRVALKYLPNSLDPINISDIYAEAVSKQIFEGLVRFGPYLEILPALASSWNIEDEGRVYRFKIRENANFHNGQPVTANDVVFSMKRLLRSGSSSVFMPHLLKITGAKSYRSRSKDSISGLQTISPKEVVIRLDEAHSPFLSALGIYQAAIVPEKDVMQTEKPFSKYPIGTGPFKFFSYDDECAIRLLRNDDYYETPSFIDEICYKTYKGKDSYSGILEDFIQGGIDEVPVYKGAREQLADHKEYNWFQRPSLSLMFYGINLQHPKLKSAALREALSISIDRERYVNEIWGGQYQSARTILPLGMPGYSPLKLAGDNEVEVAKTLLEKAFIEKKIKIPELELVSAVKSPIVDLEMELIKKFWGEIGINIKVKYITDWEQFDAYLRTDKVQLYRYAWHADLPDPDSFLYALFSSTSPDNFMQYSDEWVDTMLDKARGIVDPVKRIHMYQEIESRIMFSTPLIPLMYLNVNRVYQPYVKNINVGALGAHATSLHSVWLDKPSQSQ